MKFSIITVCKNSANTIEKTVQSVISQNYHDFEYIIIDGVSTDNTLDILNGYKNSITKIISEPDTGLYDAMNKGIGASCGEYIFFLNSDDHFVHNNILSLVVNTVDCITNHTSAELVYGDLLVLDSTTGKISLQKHNKLNLIYLIKNTPCQPATFYHRTTFEKYGLFNTDYKIVSDHEWFLRTFLKSSKKNTKPRLNTHYLDFPVTVFNTGGLSTDKKREEALNKERKAMLESFFSRRKLLVYDFISKYLRSFTRLPVIKTFFEI